MADKRPVVDDRRPADAIDQMVAHVLEVATSWLDWNGEPAHVDNRTYTPNKAIRRVGDHMLDHLAQFEAYVAGRPSLPDHWHASASTTPSDLAPFTREDLDEAKSRLERLAAMWRIRLEGLAEDDLDRSSGDEYTPREMAFCAVESGWYADAIGLLGKGAKAAAIP
jgi:hypothetical protein